VLVAVALLLQAAQQENKVELQGIGRTTHKAIREASALLPSPKHKGVYWTLNDSGNAPQLFAIDRSGKLLGEYRVRAANVDWEALACDDAGHLFIGDIGNNGGLLPTRWVYQLQEPETLQLRGPELQVEKTFWYKFPDKPFDAEAMLYQRGGLFLISKVHKHPRLYRLPLDKPGETVTLTDVCDLPKELHTVTDACLSADGRRLALISYGYAAKIALQKDEILDKLKEKTPQVRRFSKTHDVEGCGWDGDDLLLITEDGTLLSLRF
jgi:hypothetical protein